MQINENQMIERKRETKQEKNDNSNIISQNEEDIKEKHGNINILNLKKY